MRRGHDGVQKMFVGGVVCLEVVRFESTAHDSCATYVQAAFTQTVPILRTKTIDTFFKTWHHGGSLQSNHRRLIDKLIGGLQTVSMVPT